MVETKALSPHLGVQVLGAENLLDDAVVAQCLEALKWRGVLLIRGADLDDDQQLAFSRRIGEVVSHSGQAVFTGSAGCSGCHTLAAASASGTVGPDLDTRLRSDCASPASQKVRGASLKQCIDTAITRPYAFLPAGYSAGIMPSDFATRLTSDQIQALVNFLASAAK